MSGYATAVSAAVAVVGTAVSTYASYRQAEQQQRAAEEQADYQAAVAQQNQNAAEAQARAKRQQGYQEGLKKRQETALLIGKQRAQAGSSGAMVDAGSFLDLQQETAELGARDALAVQQHYYDAAYNNEVEAWNFGAQKAGAQLQKSQAADRDPFMAALPTAINGVSSIASTYGRDLWGVGKKKV